MQFGLALELARLGREASLHREIQELLLRFSRGISSTLSVAGALASLSSETNALFGTERSSVWLHNRRNRELICSAASTDDGMVGTHVSTESDTYAGPGPQARASPDRREPLAACARGPAARLAPRARHPRHRGRCPADLDEQQVLSARTNFAGSCRSRSRTSSSSKRSCSSAGCSRTPSTRSSTSSWSSTTTLQHGPDERRIRGAGESAARFCIGQPLDLVIGTGRWRNGRAGRGAASRREAGACVRRHARPIHGSAARRHLRRDGDAAHQPGRRPIGRVLVARDITRANASSRSSARRCASASPSRSGSHRSVSSSPVLRTR